MRTTIGHAKRRGTSLWLLTAGLLLAGCGGSGADADAALDGADLGFGETTTLPDADADGAADLIDESQPEIQPDTDTDDDAQAEVEVETTVEVDATPECDSADPDACDDGDPCTVGTCDAGECTYAQRDDVCRIGGTCYEDETLAPGNKCLHCDVATAAGAWTLVNCSDGDPCTSDGCTTATGCSHVGETGIACDDGVACSKNDTCKGGVCKGSVCGCLVAADCAELQEVAPPCTIVACNGGICETVADPTQDDKPCDGGFFCEIGSKCAGGVCGGGVPVDCSAFSQGPCRPGVCNPSKGCVTQVLADGTSCSDGKLCTGSETCESGVCQGSPLNCDDGNLCNGAETCDPATGCVAGKALVCDDGDMCNGKETCDPVKGCVAAVGFTCDDGNLCNGKETCDAQKGCQAGTPLACDDANPCNGAESCHPVLGCVAGAALKCTDGDVCNGLETCQAGKGCVPGVSLACSDGDACNGVEGCDPVSGCKPGQAPVCDDGEPCNGKETCDKAAGCVAGAPVVCTDGNACNGVETCGAGGVCQPGTPLTCNDQDPCNGVETCNAATGCVAGSPVICTDGNPCNGLEFCDSNGLCQKGALPACAPYACGPGGCLSACASNADCAAGAYCDTTDADGDGKTDECIAKAANGSDCAGPDFCASGYCQSATCCQSGICCKTASTCPVYEPGIDASQPFVVADADATISQNDGAAQEILVSKGAKLDQILLRLSGPGGKSLPVKVTVTTGGPTGATGSQVIALADFIFDGPGDYVVVFPAQPIVAPNTHIWVALTGTAFSAPPCGPDGCNGPVVLWQGSNSGDPYPSGTTWLSINGGTSYTSVPAIGDRSFQLRVRVHGCVDFRCAAP
ncbi:MAG: hypothetical protein R3F39_21370 [Myxococcota bacterium]